jgi:hypothetical protein
MFSFMSRLLSFDLIPVSTVVDFYVAGERAACFTRLLFFRRLKRLKVSARLDAVFPTI